VYDFRVSCARACADSLGRLDHHDFTSRESEGAGNRESDNASTNNDAINIRTHVV
jgi:hypothetical protein